ncbi:SLAP domain-containing protein [Lactobacillus sp. R2/2]|nr:SLAP domain-containing protein [Lactobacillus sp. R2/2]
MKFSHKFMMVSAAALIGISPVLSGSQVAVVQAADKPAAKKNNVKQNTIKLNHNAYVYDKNGKRLKPIWVVPKEPKLARNYPKL